jgi:hypothetical protein
MPRVSRVVAGKWLESGHTIFLRVPADELGSRVNPAKAKGLRGFVVAGKRLESGWKAAIRLSRDLNH